MRKKRLIILCSILSVIAVLIILTSTVFMLSSVKVNFLASGMQVLSEEDAEGIIKAGKFKRGSNILFTSFNKQMARIEKAYPFARVHKVERKFPNKAIVHISERTPAVYVKQNGNVYLLDSDFKILLVVFAENFNESNNIPSSALNAPQLIGMQISSGLSSGDFEDNILTSTIVKCIERGMTKLSRDILDLAQINISKNKDNQLLLTLKVGSNNMFVEIVGETALETKIVNACTAYFAHLEKNGDNGGKIYISDNTINTPTFIA